jgi:hypothetical protein
MIQEYIDGDYREYKDDNEEYNDDEDYTTTDEYKWKNELCKKWIQKYNSQ